MFKIFGPYSIFFEPGQIFLAFFALVVEVGEIDLTNAKKLSIGHTAIAQIPFLSEQWFIP